MERLLFHQGAHRASLDAFAAEHAIRLNQRTVAGSYDLGGGPPVTKTDGPIDLHLIASLDAAAAEDTTGKIANDQRMGRFLGPAMDNGVKAGGGDLVLIGQALVVALPPCRSKVRRSVCFLNVHLEPGPVVFLRGIGRGAIMVAR